MSVHRYLASDEYVVGTFRHHWIVLWKQAAIWFLVIAGAIILGGQGGLVVAGLASAWLGWHVLQWRCATVFMTSQRIVTLNGIVARRVGTIPLGKVTDTQYVQTVLGRFLGYGSIVLDLPGQDGKLPRMRRLADSQQLYDLIVAATIGRGGGHGDGTRGGDRGTAVDRAERERPRRGRADRSGGRDPGGDGDRGVGDVDADRLLAELVVDES